MTSDTSVDKLAFGTHGRRGAPVLVDTVHAQVLNAYAAYRDAIVALTWSKDSMSEPLELQSFAFYGLFPVFCSTLFLVIVCACWQLPTGVWWLLLWLHTILYAAGLVVLDCQKDRERALIRAIARHEIDVAHVSLARNDRIRRALDEPAHAAIVDLYGGRLWVKWGSGNGKEYVDERIRPWAVAPTLKVVTTLYDSLAVRGTAAEFHALTIDQQKRVLALATVKLCMFGENL